MCNCGRSEGSQVTFLESFLPCFYDMGSFSVTWSLMLRPGWLASCRGPSGSSLPVLALQVCTTVSSFLNGFWMSVSGLVLTRQELYQLNRPPSFSLKMLLFLSCFAVSRVASWLFPNHKNQFYVGSSPKHPSMNLVFSLAHHTHKAQQKGKPFMCLRV